jgi:hypothetical protein
VDAWNNVKRVRLFMLHQGQFCEAAIGNKVLSLDFKACVLPREGNDACGIAANSEKRTKRLPPFDGSFSIRIPTGVSGNQVFSRPMLSEADVEFMPPGHSGFRKLMSLELEP